MNHQITLEELGLIPKSENEHMEPKKQYASPCGGCICNHCANNAECWDDCTGEMETPCFTCDECIHYDGYGKSQKREECRNYKITNKYAEYLRRRIKIVTKTEKWGIGMKDNPANKIKDTMWYFLMDGAQKGDVQSLKEYVYDLIKMTTQKSAGQRKAKDNIPWDELDMTLMSIVIEATALVLSGSLDGLERGDGADESDIH